MSVHAQQNDIAWCVWLQWYWLCL